MDEPALRLPLQGARVAVPEARELAVFSELLERRGAEVLRCPLVAIHDAPDPAPVLAWIERFSAGACDDLILQTGEGLRRLLACLDRHAPERRADFVTALQAVRKIVRGPKPERVLRSLGLRADLQADQATTAGVISRLGREDLQGRRIGLQLYGTEPNLPLQSFLREAGAELDLVAPYVYADAADDGRVLELISELDAGRLTAIAFTSMAQVKRLFAVAEAAGQSESLRMGLSRTLVASVGPVVADTLRARGVVVNAMPAESWFMKPLTQALVQAMPAAELAGAAD